MSIFKRLSWGKEHVSVAKLKDMVSNDDYLYDTMITGYYDTLGIVRENGLSLRAGHVKALHTEEMGIFIASNYSKPFLPGARPVVVTGLSSDNYFGMLAAVKGLDGRAVPDHKGFYMMLWQLRDPGGPTKFQGEQFISYISLANG